MKSIINFLLTSVAPSTDRALAGFSKALDQLNAVVKAEERKIELIDVRIAILDEAAEAAEVRLERAARIASRFTTLVA